MNAAGGGHDEGEGTVRTVHIDYRSTKLPFTIKMFHRNKSLIVYLVVWFRIVYLFYVSFCFLRVVILCRRQTASSKSSFRI